MRFARYFRPFQRAHDLTLSLSGWRAGLLAFLLGSLAVLAHPPFGLWPLMAAGLTGLVWLLDGAARSVRPKRAGAWRAWCFAFGYFFFGLYWVGYAFLNRGPEFAPLIPFAVTILPAGLALFWALAGAASVRFWSWDFRRLFVFAAAFFIAEYARGHLFSGFPWNIPGLIWPAGGGVSQSAAWIGAYGLTLLTLLALAAPAALTDMTRIRARLGPPLAALILFLGLYGGGLVRLAGEPQAHPSDTGLRIVQSGFSQKEKWDPANRQAVIDRYITLSTQGDMSNVDLVLWPEGALPVPILEDGAVLSRLGEALGDDAWLGTGGYRRAAGLDGEIDYYNSFVLLGFPNGEARLAGLYDKRRLVPFGEYMPLEGVLSALGARLPSQIADGMSAGPGPMTLRTPAAPPFAPLICYEIIFPGYAPGGENRPDWILNVSNDAWFGPSPGPRQHLAQARYRAIETGLPVIRAASGGVSSIIGPKGGLIAAMEPGEAGVLDSPLPAALNKTLFASLGFWSPLLLLLVVVMASKLFARNILTDGE